MRLGLRELRRQPGRFAGAATVLVFVAVLLIFLGGLVDGLNANNDGALRAQAGELAVFADTAGRTVTQSVVTADARSRLEAVDGVAGVGGVDLLQLGARLPDAEPRDIVDVALFSHELPVDGRAPLPDGRVWADRTLAERGLEVGVVLRLGPAKSEVVVHGFVDDTGYQGQGSLWAGPGTFARVVEENQPANRLPPGASRFVVVALDPDADPSAVAEGADAATGVTETVTLQQAADAVLDIGGGVLSVIIGLTVVIAAAVVALFFALLTLERAPLFGVLKAVGARTRTLFAGTATQAVALAAGAGAIATAVGLLADRALPPGSIPFQLSPGRAALSVAQLLVAALVGAALCLRRIARTDPAATIGRTQ